MIINILQEFMEPEKPQKQTLKEEYEEKIEENMQVSDIKKQMSKDEGTYYPEEHPKSKKKLKINTSKARASLGLIKKIMKDHEWKEVYKEGDILWSGSNDEDGMFGDEIMINKLPAISKICNKSVFAFILNKFKEYWPEMFSFYPKTYLLPQNEQKLAKKLQKGDTYIAKPAVGSLGEGILLITKLKDIPQYGTNEWIVQPYIGNPLLLDKKKFDLRLYILISSIEPYMCYLNEEGLARLCAQDYKKPNKQNMRNSYIHLTNYYINKNHPDYVNGEDAFSRGGKRCLRTVWQDLKDQGIDVKTLRQKILQLTQRYLIGIYPFLKYYYNATFPKKEGKNFQILGIDIMVDEQLNPWLLQANSNPSFSIEHEVNGPEKKKEDSPVDEYVKRMVVEDALFIAKKNIEKQKQMQIEENYYSYKKILDEESEDIKGMNIIENMLKVFHSQCSLKSKWVLTSSQFIKLSKLPGMTNEKISKNDYHLIFIKIMRNKSNPNQMEFYDFIEAMEYIVKEIVGYSKENKLAMMQDHLDLLVNEL